MNRRQFLGMAGAAALAGVRCGRAPEAPQAGGRPNIVLMMADDMGFSDLGCYGSEIATPNLDRLAASGVRFTQFYNTARCCPTRASLMTGLYPHQAGVGHMVDIRKPFPGYVGDLSPHCVTIAEVLRGAGYRTWMSGKWHVTPVTESKDNWPLQRGFERFYGTIHGAGSFYDPVTLTRGNDAVQPEGEDYYYTHAIAGEAAKWIEEDESKDPFFLYVAFTSPHWPLHALPEDVAKYKGRYDGGWDALRAARHKRMVEMGLVDAAWDLTERDEKVPAWEDAEDKEWQARRMEVYAAQVDAMDQAVGRLLHALERSGRMDDTLILFLADNGGCAEELRPRETPPAQLHVPQKTRDGRPVQFGNRPDRMPGADDTYQSYGVPWANASNTPFRLYKHWVHEGGIASPLIAHWPGGFAARGEMRSEPAHLIDIMATCADVAKAAYPRERMGQGVMPMEGRSLAPVFGSAEPQAVRQLFWEHEGNRAVREGKWKLVSRYNNRSEWELYDLEADRTETENLIAGQPEIAKRLQQAYAQWAARAQVVEWKTVTDAAAVEIPGNLYPKR